MIRKEWRKAARMWLERRGWKIAADVEVGGTFGDVQAASITATKDSTTKKFLVIQHRVFFDHKCLETPDDDSDTNHFPVPRNEVFYDNFDADNHHSIMCFNSSRTYCAFVDSNVWNVSRTLNDGTKLIHRDDVNVIACPWRIWAVDNLPEWLQRGWPNPDHGGEIGKPETWSFHPNWHDQAMKSADPYNRLPNTIDEALQHKEFHTWRESGWYKEWLKTKDDIVLPWYTDESPAPDELEMEIEQALKDLAQYHTSPIESEFTHSEAFALVVIRRAKQDGMIMADITAQYAKRYPEFTTNDSNTNARTTTLQDKGLVIWHGKRKNPATNRMMQVWIAAEYATSDQIIEWCDEYHKTKNGVESRLKSPLYAKYKTAQ